MVRKQMMTVMLMTLLIFASAIAFAEDSTQPGSSPKTFNNVIPETGDSTRSDMNDDSSSTNDPINGSPTNRPSPGTTDGTDRPRSVPSLTQSQIQAIETSCVQKHQSNTTGYNNCVRDQKKTECSKTYKANSTDYSGCIK